MQTTLSTTKKVTVIYQQIVSSLLFLLISFSSFAAEDLASFCFKRTTNLAEAQKSLQFLLLPKEQIFLRPDDNCMDVNTSTDRSKLLEKFLSKRYNLIEETGVSKETSDLTKKNCQIELTTTRKKNIISTDAQLGITKLPNAATGSLSQNEVSVSQLLLGLGKPGMLELEGKTLYVTCSGGHRGFYQLEFYYSEEFRSKVSTELTVKQGEVINIGSISNNLNEKSKTLGLPESSYRVTNGSENINYELMIK